MEDPKKSPVERGAHGADEINPDKYRERRYGHLRLISAEPPAQAVERPPLEYLAVTQAPERRWLVQHLTANRPLGVYVSGLPGTGKSTLLLHMVLDDIRAGRACCVLDPHGDLIPAILARCPEDEMVLRRIVLFDPADTEWPVGLNLLDAKTERGQDLAVQFMLDLFEEMYLLEHQGPVLHQAVRHGMRLLMELGGSLAELPVLFTERDFLRAKLQQCKNPWVRHYFEKVWLEITEDRGGWRAYLTSKLSPFLDDHILRRIVGQREGLDLQAALSKRGVVLANLARGEIGERNSGLLGRMLLHKLERLTVERSGLPPEARPRLHVYVDEFQEFATLSLARFLAAARKFNVGLTLAHQRLETLDKRLQESILGTVGHAVLFRQGAGDIFRVVPQLVWPFGERELASLSNYEAIVRVTDARGRRTIGRLRVPAPGGAFSDTVERVRFLARARVARQREEVEEALLSRLGWGAAGSSGSNAEL
jgi:hypothetical protein